MFYNLAKTWAAPLQGTRPPQAIVSTSTLGLCTLHGKNRLKMIIVPRNRRAMATLLGKKRNENAHNSCFPVTSDICKQAFIVFILTEQKCYWLLAISTLSVLTNRTRAW